MELHAQRPNEKVRVTHFHMPNMNFFTTAGNDWDPDPEAVPSNNLAWRVPVDDEHCLSFYVVHIPAGAAAERYAARRATRPRDFIPPPRLGDAVLRGEHRIEDITAPTNLINVQDYVAQVGQGAIAPREVDRLGRSDVGVILLRQIWERELRALDAGRPLKQWGRAERVQAVFGA
jgi:5,5'-dehydrodivanillate O-demethylase